MNLSQENVIPCARKTGSLGKKEIVPKEGLTTEETTAKLAISYAYRLIHTSYMLYHIYIHSSSFFQKPSTGLGLLLVLVHWSVFPLKSLYLGKPCLEREATKASVREIQYRLLREVLNPVSICQRLFLSRSKGLNR